MPEAPFPDIEVAIAILLEPLGSTGTVTPADLKDHLPFHRVRRFSGTDDRITDTARLTIDTFGDTRQNAKAAAELVRQLLIAGPHRIEIETEDEPMVVIVDQIRTETSPAELPWSGDKNLSRWEATYTARARR